MIKLAQAVVEESAKESVTEAPSDRDKLYLKLQKEAEIRMKLDEFARELSQVKATRKEH